MTVCYSPFSLCSNVPVILQFIQNLTFSAIGLILKISETKVPSGMQVASERNNLHYAEIS